MKRPTGAGAFLGWLFLFSLVPFLIILGMSFLQKSGPGIILFKPTLGNFARCFDLVYARVLVKTVWVALTATFSCLMIGFPVAYFLAKTQGNFRQVGLILLFIPFWTNFILRMYGIISLVGNHGLFNQVLLHTGLISDPIEVLYTRVGVYIGLVHNYLPFLVVPVFSSLEKLDPSLR